MKPVICLLLLCFPGAAAVELPGAVAIQRAKVVTVSGPVIDRGTVILRGGLIESVGAEVSVPADAWVIDGAGLTVYPGLIDALSGLGIPKAPERGTGNTEPEGSRPTSSEPPPRGPEDRPMNTSWLRAADLVKPTDKRLEAARNAGFTTAVTFLRKGVFGGQGTVVNLAGDRPGEMVVSPAVGQYLAFATSGSGSFPESLMGTIAYIRQVYLDADRYREAKAVYAAGAAGLRRPDYDRALEGVLANDRVLLPATRALDVRRALRLAADLGRETVLYGGHEAYGAVDDLKKGDVAILVNLKWPARDKKADPEREEPLRVLELREKAPTTPKALTDAGVRWAFYAGDVEKPADAIKAVKKAMDAGLKQADAVRAMTLSAAEIYGVADRLGSLEPGKIANLVITDGELFAEKTKVKQVFIDGVKFTPLVEPPRKEEKKEAAR